MVRWLIFFDHVVGLFKIYAVASLVAKAPNHNTRVILQYLGIVAISLKVSLFVLGHIGQ